MANYNGTNGNDGFPFPLGPFLNDGRNDSIRGFDGDDRLGGKDGRDTLRGGRGNDELDGDDGNDLLDGGKDLDVVRGGAGNDTLLVNELGPLVLVNRDFSDFYEGGAGDDLYIITDDTSFWRIFEQDNGGIDTVRSSLSIDLGGQNFLPASPSFIDRLFGGNNVEILILTGHADAFGVGNGEDNRLEGNSGDNLLFGAGGRDTLFGLQGDDTLVASFGARHLAGPPSTDGGDPDFMHGGAGDDRYIISDRNDLAIEDALGGVDTAVLSVDSDEPDFTYRLPDFVENLLLQDPDTENPLPGSEYTEDRQPIRTDMRGAGNFLNNRITGGSGSNVINGGDGRDTIDGADGNDRVLGDGGSDSLLGGAGNDTVRGGDASDTLRGGSGRDSLAGEAGDDLLDGSASLLNQVDTLVGGFGNDTYIISGVMDTVVEASLSGVDVIESDLAITALPFNVENLVLSGASSREGTGNDLDNRISGNGLGNRLSGRGGNDFLDGGLGADTMVGGAGDDTYVVEGASDVVEELEGLGTDMVQSSVSFILGASFERLVLTGTAVSGRGNAGGNTLSGNVAPNILSGEGGNDSLDGGTGSDTMVGGIGSDTYVVDNIGDLVVEPPSDVIPVPAPVSGSDSDTVRSSVAFALPSNVENLVLTGAASINGTGNAFDNTLTGNAGSNSLGGLGGNDRLIGLGGADTLEGIGGADTLEGGEGDDVYRINSALADVVIELADAGTDTVQSPVSYSLGLASGLEVNLERLILTGSTAIEGTGNLANNTLKGNSGSNRLLGLAGADNLQGRGGSDTLRGCSVDTAGRNEIDTLTGGTDLDVFELGSAAGLRFYDDGIASNAGRGDYALITDFTAGEDLLQLAGERSQYFLGASGVDGVAGSGLFHDSNANQSLDANDELVGIIRRASGTPTLNAANTITTALFV